MNLIQLKYFREVYSEKTVSAAAEKLNISQPSLSNAIKMLEEEFSVSLFNRESRGMVPTEAGETLFALSENLISMSEKTEEIMKDIGKKKRVLRLGVPPMIGSVMLPDIYREFLRYNPEIQLEITEMGQKELIKYIDDGFVDMALLPHNYTLPQSLATAKVSEFEIVCCASEKNKIAGSKVLKPQDLEDVPLVLFKDGFFQTEEIKKWFAVSGINPEIMLQTSQLSTILSIISENIAIGFMFRELIDKNKNLIKIPLENPIYVDISLVWKKGAYLFDNMKKFREYMMKK